MKIKLNKINATIEEVYEKAKEYNFINRFFEVVDCSTLSLDDFLFCYDNLPIESFKNDSFNYFRIPNYDFLDRDEDLLKMQSIINKFKSLKIPTYNNVSEIAYRLPRNLDTLIKICIMNNDNITDVIKAISGDLPEELMWVIINLYMDNKIIFRREPTSYINRIQRSLTKSMVKELLLNNCCRLLGRPNNDYIREILKDKNVLKYMIRKHKDGFISNSDFDSIEMIRSYLTGASIYKNIYGFLSYHINMIKKDPVSISYVLKLCNIYTLNLEYSSYPRLRKFEEMFLILSDDLKCDVLRNSFYRYNLDIFMKLLRQHDISTFERIIYVNRDNNGKKIFNIKTIGYLMDTLGNSLYFDYIRDSIWYNQEEKDYIYNNYVSLTSKKEFVEMFK